MERAPAPYGKCQEKSDPKINAYGEKYPVDYSSEVSVLKKSSASACTVHFSFCNEKFLVTYYFIVTS